MSGIAPRKHALTQHSLQMEHHPARDRSLHHLGHPYQSGGKDVSLSYVAMRLERKCPAHTQGFDLLAQGFWFWMEGVMNIFFWAGQQGSLSSFGNCCKRARWNAAYVSLCRFSDLVMNFFVAYESPVTGELVTDHRCVIQGGGHRGRAYMG